ncbi:MAG: hypothetical protein KGM96_15750 [Acidobacteriota bacterium]|nr:hypothetical protein [Acidobacteriota bacterium]
MNFNRTFVPVAALALAVGLSLSGCKSTNQQADNQNAQTAQPSAPGTAQTGPGTSQPGEPGQPGQPGQSAPSRRSSPQQYAGGGGAPQGPQQPPPPAMVDLPSGTHLRVRLDEDLGSKISQAGDNFSATIADDVVVDGQTVIARGARAEGTVIDAKPLGRFKGGAALAIRLERVQAVSGSYPVATSTMSKVEQGKGRRSAEFIGGGAGLGALIGGLAGGGKGALIGGLAGAGAGTAGTAFTGNKEILLPAETMLTFTLEHSVHIAM